MLSHAEQVEIERQDRRRRREREQAELIELWMRTHPEKPAQSEKREPYVRESMRVHRAHDTSKYPRQRAVGVASLNGEKLSSEPSYTRIIGDTVTVVPITRKGGIRKTRPTTTVIEAPQRKEVERLGGSQADWD